LINFVNSALTYYTWGIVCILIFFLFAIGRFYEEKSGRRSFYALFLVPLVLLGIAAIIYAPLSPLIVGNFWGDLVRCIGGIVLGGAGLYLLGLMIGGRS
jgi:hypothetical protein